MNPMSRISLFLSATIASVVTPTIAFATGSFSDDFSDPSSGWVNTQVADHKANGIALYDSSGGYVSGGHGYAILKVKDGQAEQLATGRFEGAMPNIADVQISARCEGSTLALSLDGEEVANASDADLSKGASGLIVMGEKTAGTSAVFDNFELSGS